VVVHFRRDTLQHDLTIGEPPQDIGSLFEIAGVWPSWWAPSPPRSSTRGAGPGPGLRARAVLGTLAVVLFVGMGWWFTHPIDQSRPGAPEHMSGNPVYNVFH
jgi:hypothetical protein